MRHEFGGDWTERKLDCLRSYIRQWLMVMSKQPFQRFYIDAFSGTGERHQTSEEVEVGFGLDELKEAARFFDGSAKIALEFDKGFDRHILIEQHKGRFNALTKLKNQYPKKSIEFRNQDANVAVREICTILRRTRLARAVMFLDPYGCQVNWSTVEEIADTGVIDLWYLFPTGAVLRLLPHNRARQLPQWEARLSALLGTDEWQERFYLKNDAPTLFDMGERFERSATPETVEQFVIARLKEAFPSVANSCMRLANRQGFPNFSLCFAAGASPEHGGGIALNISEHLIKKGR